MGAVIRTATALYILKREYRARWRSCFQSPPSFRGQSAGASITEWIKTLNAGVASFDDNTVYVCGHAGKGYDIVINKADVLAFKDYLHNVLKFTKENIDAGTLREPF